MMPITTSAPARRPKRPDKAPRRDRDDWLDTARRALIEGGVDRVKVEPLAGQLGVTTGSFYHHFTNRQELLDGLLAHWETRNSEPWFEAVRAAGPDANAQLDALFDIWVEESAYDPAYDSAVRDWARISPLAEAAVRRADDRRIALLQQVFEGFGYDPDRAFIRARVTYFHQVGYQAMKITEPHERRLQLRPLYREALVGTPPRRPG
jgi:AcrR family transcriptional regulator